jgi:hypothetical protein
MAEKARAMTADFVREMRYVNRIKAAMTKHLRNKDAEEASFCIGELEAVAMHSEDEAVRARALLAIGNGQAVLGLQEDLAIEPGADSGKPKERSDEE